MDTRVSIVTGLAVGIQVTYLFWKNNRALSELYEIVIVFLCSTAVFLGNLQLEYREILKTSEIKDIKILRDNREN